MNKKILVIDDEKNIRLTLSECLETSNYDVETAVSGEHGMTKYNESKYDVILLDMKMPGIDGMEVLRRIKEQDPLQNIIMITAHGTIETAVEAMKLGAIDYIRKPFTPDEIRSIVKRVLERHHLDEGAAAASFHAALEYAKGCINRRDFDKAYQYLQKAICMEPRTPEPYNLLGVILELNKETVEALKMYRAALAVDPTYKPANANLTRATKWDYTKTGIQLGGEDDENQPQGDRI
jgi:DNA-binding response OmpR family regulator